MFSEGLVLDEAEAVFVFDNPGTVKTHFCVLLLPSHWSVMGRVGFMLQKLRKAHTCHASLTTSALFSRWGTSLHFWPKAVKGNV
jgi:hypothetical protein